MDFKIIWSSDHGDITKVFEKITKLIHLGKLKEIPIVK